MIGHLFSLDFCEATGSDPGNLYGAATQKVPEESTAAHGVCEHIAAAAQGCDYLFLWLDCDREGENICYEVISVCRSAGRFTQDRAIFRAHFSALTDSAVREAWRRPSRTNQAHASAVDARQQLDLKVGCSFTRLLTRTLLPLAQQRFDPSLRVLSYGPCQTPTLNFCVERHRANATFVPRQYWQLSITAAAPNHHRSQPPVQLTSVRGRMFNLNTPRKAHAQARSSSIAVVRSVKSKQLRENAPAALDTVGLLRGASLRLGVSPARCMQLAESLYTSGLISYPRTETSQYPHSFNARAVLEQLQAIGRWAEAADWALSQSSGQLPTGGKDAGDHPPITPTAAVARHGLRSEMEWRLYEMVVLHFIGSLAGPLIYTEVVTEACIGQERFVATCHQIEAEGWSRVLPWRLQQLSLQLGCRIQASVGAELEVHGTKLEEGWTEPPW